MCSTPRGNTYRPLRATRPLCADPDYSNMVRRSEISYAKRQQERLQRRLDAEHPHAEVLHIDRLACPLHLIKLKQALESIEPLQRLRVIPGSPALVQDLTSACQQLGLELERVETPQGGVELFVTRSSAIDTNQRTG